MTAVSSAQGSYQAGQEAFNKGDYRTALSRWKPLAEQGHVAAQTSVANILTLGLGTQRDLPEGIKWYSRAAEKGYAPAQYSLGQLYFLGLGVIQNYRLAANWYRLAAEQDYSKAQFRMGIAYRLAQGVPESSVEAHMWFNLAAANGYPKAAEARDELAKHMTAAQIAEAQDKASARHSGIHQANAASTRKGEEQVSELASTGTGFVVSPKGHVLTNQHVIGDCPTLFGKNSSSGRQKLVVLSQDAENDLAVLGFFKASVSAVEFSNSRLELGQNVIVMGYPLQLASSISVTTGTVSALAGVQDDTRMFQVTAPVQAGNSGGPVLSQSGTLVGVISSKLNLVETAKLTGDFPQNVNFAIKASLVQLFLESNGVSYNISPSMSSSPVPRIAEKFRESVLLIECWK